MKTAFVLAAAIAVAALVTSGAGARHGRRASVATGVIVDSAVVDPWYGGHQLGHSPIHTDPLCVWRHHAVCNPWFCQQRKVRVCH
ncbi:MAG: hypothetical protein ACREBP_06985 [Sphingomicrobium sp.]